MFFDIGPVLSAVFILMEKTISLFRKYRWTTPEEAIRQGSDRTRCYTLRGLLWDVLRLQRRLVTVCVVKIEKILPV